MARQIGPRGQNKMKPGMTEMAVIVLARSRPIWFGGGYRR
jgi:hypothetical protein